MKLSPLKVFKIKTNAHHNIKLYGNVRAKKMGIHDIDSRLNDNWLVIKLFVSGVELLPLSNST